MRPGFRSSWRPMCSRIIGSGLNILIRATINDKSTCPKMAIDSCADSTHQCSFTHCRTPLLLTGSSSGSLALAQRSQAVPASHRSAFRRRRRELRRIVDRAEARLAERSLLPAAASGARHAPRRDGVLEELMRRAARVDRRLRRSGQGADSEKLGEVAADLRLAVRDVQAAAAAGDGPAASSSSHKAAAQVCAVSAAVSAFFLYVEAGGVATAAGNRRGSCPQLRPSRITGGCAATPCRLAASGQGRSRPEACRSAPGRGRRLWRGGFGGAHSGTDSTGGRGAAGRGARHFGCGNRGSGGGAATGGGGRKGRGEGGGGRGCCEEGGAGGVSEGCAGGGDVAAVPGGAGSRGIGRPVWMRCDSWRDTDSCCLAAMLLTSCDAAALLRCC